MKCDNERAARLLEQSFIGELEPAGHEELHQHLATCDDCRSIYERQVAVERHLELGSPPLPAAHLDLIGQAVLARVQAEAKKPAKASWWRWAFAIPAAAVAVVLAVLFVPRPVDDGFQARSGAVLPVEGLRAFCIGQDAGNSRILASASVGDEAPLRCGTVDSLQFSYTTGEVPLHLAIVSLPEGGDGPAMQYTTGDATMPVAAKALDEPLPYSTRLAARHTPGRRILLGLFFDQPKAAAEIEDAARALVRGAKAPAGLRVSLRSTLVVD